MSGETSKHSNVQVVATILLEIGFTQDRDLAVLCPACPHPGKTLPTNWETSPLS
jgi:hypothetical protein